MDLEDYLRNYYGLCSAKKCKCLIRMWKGTLCHNWQSSEANSIEELAEFQKKVVNARTQTSDN